MSSKYGKYKNKYKKRDDEHKKNLEMMIEDSKDAYNPSRLEVDKPKPLTSKDLPDRPRTPRKPKLQIDGVLRSELVEAPSGRKDPKTGKPERIRQYRANEKNDRVLNRNYNNMYGRHHGVKALRKFKKDAKASKGNL